MTNETVHMQPAIPSRAATAPATPFAQPAFIDQPSPGTAPAKKKKRSAKKKVKALPAAEIKKINAKREKAKMARRFAVAQRMAKEDTKATKKRRAKRVVGKHLALAAPYGKPKNPNRPLEMKNQLSAVLSMVGTLQKAELMFFSQAVPAMQALSRAGRRRVIAALQQVYGS